MKECDNQSVGSRMTGSGLKEVVLFVRTVQSDVTNGPECRFKDEVMELEMREMVLLIRKVRPDVPDGPNQRM